jgi:hypothetical protein
MAETFFTLSDGSPRAVMGIRRRSNGTVQTLDEAVPDGDTTGTQLDGTGSARFLGVDTPEKSFEQPLGGAQNLDGPLWEQYLTNPFANGFPVPSLEPELAAHLQPRFGSGAAANHYRHAVAASDALKQLIQSDVAALGQTAEQFRYFLSFSYEVFDRYGRFLAFVNRNQPNPTVPSPRPRSYNERQLERGVRCRTSSGPTSTRFARPRQCQTPCHLLARRMCWPKPVDLNAGARCGQERARHGLGVFDPADPLRFEAFEIRYLGRGEVPTRAVIDLQERYGHLAGPELLQIPHTEDRLFVPAEFTPLFAAKGWRLEGFL